MNNDKKMEILNRLVKDGAIDLAEALVLLETEKEYVPYIQTPPRTTNPYPFGEPNPLSPYYYNPGDYPFVEQPRITFNSGTGRSTINMGNIACVTE